MPSRNIRSTESAADEGQLPVESEHLQGNCRLPLTWGAATERSVAWRTVGRLNNDPRPPLPGKLDPEFDWKKFNDLLQSHGLTPLECPVVSSARDAACKAIGQVVDANSGDRTVRLALAVTGFHAGVEINARKEAMEALHSIVLELGGKMGAKTYHQIVRAEALKPEDWRPEVLQLLQSLRYDSAHDADADAWLTRARNLLAPFLGSSGSIAQKLRNHQTLSAVLTVNRRPI